MKGLFMQKTFHIRYTSDIHGYFSPTSYADTQEREIGLLRLMTEYPHDGNTLLIDGGDTLQGSPFTNYYERIAPEFKLFQLSDNSYGSHPVAAMMNLAGYQYITLGNHDFNFGLEELATYLRQLRATCLLANVRDNAGRLPLQRYAIHTLENGLRIGLAGVTSHYIRVWEKPETVEQLEIEDAFTSAREVYEELRGQCDFSILIYHGGYECDLNTRRVLSTDTENQACRICDEIGSPEDASAVAECQRSGVDVIATVHAGSPEELYHRRDLRRILLTGAFETLVFLSDRAHAGQIRTLAKAGESFAS